MPFRPGAREGLIETHLPLVRAVARRYAGRGVELDDLVQAGSVGLVKASRRFDPARGIAFAAFAAPTIEGEIRHHLRDRAGPIRVPRDLQALAARLRRDEPALASSLGRPPSTAELAARLEVSVEQVQQVRALTQLRTVVPPENGATASDAAAAPEEQAAVRLLLTEQLRRLDERERQVVYLRFHRDLSERQIAREVGISQAQVSRLLARALDKLRAAAEAEAEAGTGLPAEPEPDPETPTEPGRVHGSAASAPSRRARRGSPRPPRAATHSGRFRVRMPSELHEALAQAALDRDVSLNRYVVDALRAAVGGATVPPDGKEAPDAADAADGPGRAASPTRGPSRRLVGVLLAANTIVLILAAVIAAGLVAIALIQGS